MSYNVLIYNKTFFIRKSVIEGVLEQFPKALLCFAESFDDFLLLFLKNEYNLIVADIELEKIDVLNLVAVLTKISASYSKFVIIYDCDVEIFEKMVLPDNIIFLNKKSKNLFEKIKVLVRNDYVIDLKEQSSKNKYIGDFFFNELVALSKRELECAKLLMNGFSNVIISRKLSISVTTVSTYKKRILQKTKTNNIVELTRLLSKNPSILNRF